MNEKLDEIKAKIASSKEGFKLQIKVCANSKKDSYEILENDPSGNLMKIKIAKPAVDGKANKAITEYFSDLFDIPKSNVKIISGEKSSQKLLLIRPKSNIID